MWYHALPSGKTTLTGGEPDSFYRSDSEDAFRAQEEGKQRHSPAASSFAVSIPSAERRKDDFYFDKGECVNGNESRRAGHHRPRGKLCPAAQRASAPVRSVYHRAHGRAVPRKGREYHQRGARRAGQRHLRLSGKIGRLDGITAKTVYAPEGSIGKEENQ